MLKTALNRLAGKAEPAGVLASIEDPMVLARLATFTTLASSANAALFVLLFFAFDEPVAAWATIALSVGIVTLWVWNAYGPGSGRMIDVARVIVLLATANHVAVHISLGGFANSGAYLSFGITATLIGSLVLPRAETLVAGGSAIAIPVILAFFEGPLSASRPPPDPTLSTILFVMVLGGNVFMLVSVFLYFMERYSAERARAEGLLLNVLPEEVAIELKQKGTTTARRFESISVLFADVVGFTPMAAGTDPEEVVTRLNEVFTFFDSLVDEYGSEKIRTMGDAYMVACGVPVPREDHAHALAAMALDMLAYGRRGPLRFRIGINSGPVIAGVIGTKKFQYDIWGDTVNLASRMESQGRPGKIQITESTYLLIKDRFRCVPHGVVEIKGKGSTTTWFLEGSWDEARPRSPEWYGHFSRTPRGRPVEE